MKIKKTKRTKSDGKTIVLARDRATNGQWKIKVKYRPEMTVQTVTRHMADIATARTHSVKEGSQLGSQRQRLTKAHEIRSVASCSCA